MQNKIRHFLGLWGVILAGFLFASSYCVLLYFSGETVSSFVRGLGYFSLVLILAGGYYKLYKKNKVLLSNLVLILLLFCVVEIVFFVILGFPSVKNKKFALPQLPEDHIAMNIGTVPYADSVHKAVLIKDADTVYNVKYSIDGNCTRITPSHDTARKKHALFFGCSITFGEGVEDNQTLPYYFQELTNEYNSYNYALSGQGTNNMLARLQYSDLSNDVIETEGKAYYIFYWDHLYRSIGTMKRYTDWMINEPYYEYQDGVLKRNKMFKNGRYFTSKIYEWIYQSNIIRYFDIDFPLKLQDSHFEFVADLVLESKKEYSKQFNSDNFTCVIYPNFKEIKMEKLSYFKELLDKRGVRVIDLTDFEYQKEHTLGGDPHPNSDTHKKIAQLIIERSL